MDETQLSGIEVRVGAQRADASACAISNVRQIHTRGSWLMARAAVTMTAEGSKMAPAGLFPIAALASTVHTGLCLLVVGLFIAGSVQ